jgi:hypothetical protein
MNINDRELLARTLQAEAGSQGYDGMLAAGSVIMNRANATGYGDGMRGVILKPGQFSVWNSRKGPDGNPIYANGEQGRDMAAMRASDGAYKAADALIAGTYEDATGGATHYYNPEYSQPKWGQKAGGDWKRIGDHVFGFADAGKKPNPNQAIASDTMKALGSLPNAVGLLGSAQAANNTESKMIPEEKPRGLLGSLGIQKMEEGAEGEAGQRFFQRDTFKDTAAQLAQGFAAMGSSPALQKMTADVASQRTESKAKNKTIEYLRANGRGDLADAVDSGSLGIRDAAGIMFAQPKDGSTAAEDKIARLMSTGLSEDIAIGLADGRLISTTNPVTGDTIIIDKATGKKMFGNEMPSQPANAGGTDAAEGGDTFEGADVRGATGASGLIASVINSTFDAVGAEQPSQEIAKATTALNSLSTSTMLGLASEFPGRPSNLTRESILALTIRPGELTQGPGKALSKAEDMVKTINRSLSAANQLIAGGGSPSDVAAARKSINMLKPLLADYTSLANKLQQDSPAASVTISESQNDLLNRYAPEIVR